MTHDCPHCETFVSGYHECDAGSDRVAFECSDCHEEVDRDSLKMDITGIAPSRCASCALERMAER